MSESEINVILLHTIHEISIPPVFERPVNSSKTGERITLTRHLKNLYQKMKVRTQGYIR